MVVTSIVVPGEKVGALVIMGPLWITMGLDVVKVGTNALGEVAQSILSGGGLLGRWGDREISESESLSEELLSLDVKLALFFVSITAVLGISLLTGE